MAEIIKCTCPKCNKEFKNNKFTYYQGYGFAAPDVIFLDFNIKCECGNNFVFTEFYKKVYSKIDTPDILNSEKDLKEAVENIPEDVEL